MLISNFQIMQLMTVAQNSLADLIFMERANALSTEGKENIDRIINLLNQINSQQSKELRNIE